MENQPNRERRPDAQFNIDLAEKLHLHELLKEAGQHRVFHQHGIRLGLFQQVVIMFHGRLSAERQKHYAVRKYTLTQTIADFEGEKRSVGAFFDKEETGMYVIDPVSKPINKMVPASILTGDINVEWALDTFEQEIRLDLTRLKLLWLDKQSGTSAVGK